MRLNKYIAQAGVASRRKADELTLEGKITINGAVMKQPGYDVQEGDVVCVCGKVISASEKLVYYALNKPVGFVTTTSDEKNRPTVLSLMTDVTERVYPVGRLDFDTCGLLLMTNDGELSNRIAHPSGTVEKTYLAIINGCLNLDQIWQLRNGVEIEVEELKKTAGKNGRKETVRVTRKYKTRPAQVDVLEQRAHESTIQIKICEGKNRQVRKMVEAVGYRVLALQRTAIGPVQLGRTKEGTFRKLTKEEVDWLKNC